MIINLPKFTPHPGQQRILDSACHRNLCCMGRRYGKTSLMVEIALNFPGGALAGCDGNGSGGAPVAWIAPDMNFGMARVIDEIISAYHPLIRSSTAQCIKFKNGGRIDFWTMVRPMNCGRGTYYSRIIVDEAAHSTNLKPAWELTLAPTLGDLEGDAWFISTPKGLNYFYELAQLAKSRDDWAFHNAPSFDNPYLSKHTVQEWKETMPALNWQQEVLGEFVVFGAGLVKPEHIIIERPPVGIRWVMGVDLAISTKSRADYTAIAIVGRHNESGTVYIADVTRFRGEFQDVISRIKDTARIWKPSQIVIEEVQYQAAVVQELCRTTTLPIKGVKPDKDKLTRAMPLINRYERGLVRHSPDIPGWFKDELLSFPETEYDDGVDAVAYAYNGIDNTLAVWERLIPRY